MSDIGLFSKYLTAGDLTDRPQGLEAVGAALAAVPVEQALGWVAGMLAPKPLPSMRGTA